MPSTTGSPSGSGLSPRSSSPSSSLSPSPPSSTSLLPPPSTPSSSSSTSPSSKHKHKHKREKSSSSSHRRDKHDKTSSSSSSSSSSSATPPLAGTSTSSPSVLIQTPNLATPAATSTSPPSRPRKGPPLRLEISVPVAAPPPSSPYAFTPSGTFTEDDLRINKSGLKIGRSGSGTSKSKAKTSPKNSVEDDGLRLEDLEDLELCLGSGAGGYVRKFRHRKTNQVMAMKIIQLDVTEDIRRKILMELRTLHQSAHESIVSFYDAFYADGCIYIALEFMDSGNLADVLKQVGKIPEPILAKITIQLLRGIEYIHKELRVVHRDIKPSNLLLNSRGEVKITDFGVSGKLANTIAKAQTFVGTVTYMSPERIRAQDHASNSDIWSLGLTILECALGYYPYRPPAPVTTSSSYPQPQQQGYTFFELLEDIQTNPAPTLPEEGFSKEFRDFINLSLEKDPSVRPNASELLEHSFVKKYETETIDVAEWLRTILQKMGKL